MNLEESDVMPNSFALVFGVFEIFQQSSVAVQNNMCWYPISRGLLCRYITVFNGHDAGENKKYKLGPNLQKMREL